MPQPLAGVAALVRLAHPALAIMAGLVALGRHHQSLARQQPTLAAVAALETMVAGAVALAVEVLAVLLPLALTQRRTLGAAVVGLTLTIAQAQVALAL